MNKSDILSLYAKSSKVNWIATALEQPQAKLQVKGLVGSSFSLVLQSVFEKQQLPFLLLFQDKEEAAYFLNDFEGLFPDDKRILFYPASYRVPYQQEQTDNSNVVARAEVLDGVAAAATGSPAPASVRRFYWSEDVGYALWLRLYLESARLGLLADNGNGLDNNTGSSAADGRRTAPKTP